MRVIMADQKIIGRAFLDIAETIKNKIASNLVEKNADENMQLTTEQLSQVISFSQVAVDQITGDALDTIIRLTTVVEPPKKTKKRRR